MIRHLLVFLLAGVCCHQAVQGAVTVYQVSFGVTVGGPNLSGGGGLLVNGVALAPVGSVTSPAAASLWAGTGILSVEGSRIDYQFSMTDAFPSLSSMTFESGAAAEQPGWAARSFFSALTVVPACLRAPSPLSAPMARRSSIRCI